MDLAVYGALCPPKRERETAYWLLAMAVQQVAGVSSLPRIERAAGGKPWFPERPGLHFNISHSHGCAVCALHDQKVGVDVERLRAAPKRLAQGMGDETFFRLWTAKEATIKRDGRSVVLLRKPFQPDPLCRNLDDFLPGCAVAVCPAEAVPVQAVRWAYQDLLKTC